MSKTAAAKKQDEEVKLPATQSAAGVPAELAGMMEQDAGKGVSGAAEDNLVPLVYILQALSPQVDANSAAHIPGAKAGDIWLRGAREPVVDGTKGVSFQPCFIYKDWVEWMPDRGGFVGKHAERPETAKPDADNKNKWRMPNGNSVVETRYVVGYMIIGTLKMPYIIPFSSTGHTVERGWNTARGSHKMPNGQPMPAFASLWELKTVQRSNKKGKWYSVSPSWLSYVDKETYLEGRALHDAMASGAKKAEAPTEEDPTDDVSAGGGGDEADNHLS